MAMASALRYTIGTLAQGPENPRPHAGRLSIFTHVQQQKRRIVFSGALTFFAALALYRHIDGTAFGLSAPVAIALIYAVTVMCAALVTTYFLPSVRQLVEAIAVTRMGFAGAVFLMPGLGHPMQDSPFLSSTLIIANAALLLTLGPRICGICKSRFSETPLHTLALSVERCAIWLDRCEDGTTRSARRRNMGRA